MSIGGQNVSNFVLEIEHPKIVMLLFTKLFKKNDPQGQVIKNKKENLGKVIPDKKESW